MDLKPKKYYSIGEVSRIVGLKEHVLRFWEKEFEQLDPKKSASKRRKYTDDDIEVIQHIKRLLYVEGFTIQGAQKQMEGEETAKPSNKDVEMKNMKTGQIPPKVDKPKINSQKKSHLITNERQVIIKQLKEISEMLK